MTEPLAEELARLTAVLLGAETVAEVLENVTVTARRVLPQADVVSVTLRSADGHYHTVAPTDPVAVQLDKIQYETGEGPCVTAADPAGPGYVHCADLLEAPSWPTFAPAAVELGFRATLATALLTTEDRDPDQTGALNVFCRHPDTLDKKARDVALLLATHASLALASTTAVTKAALQEAHLRRAIASRDVIGQAKGILMQRRGISAEEAFTLLRTASMDLNRKLADIAATIVARRGDLG